MTDREMLSELICASINDGCVGFCNISSASKCLRCTCIADHLLANGVTFAKDMNVPSKVETNVYDTVEIHHNCTVQILRNSVTGEQSIGWWPEEQPPKEV